MEQLNRKLSRRVALHRLRDSYIEKLSNGEREGNKLAWQTVIIETRMLVRQILVDYNAFRDERDRGQREKIRKEKQGIIDLSVETKLREMDELINQAQKFLVIQGKIMDGALRLWQQAGATIEDLCKLCNLNYEKIIQEIPDIVDESLADAAFTYNLDYMKNKGDWIDTRLDGPITHCLIEYFRDQLLTNHLAKKELCEALLKSFQEMKPEEFAKYVVAYLDTDEIKAMCFFGFFDHSAIKLKLLEIQDEDQ